MEEGGETLGVFKALHVLFCTLPVLGETEVYKFDAICLPSFPVFIAHSQLQDAGAEYLGPIILRFHVYLFASKVTIQNSIIFAYSSSISVAGQENADCAENGTEDGRHEEATVCELIVRV